jgi:hypothetical protein
MAAAAALTPASQERMASIVFSIRVSSSQPSITAPFSITGREQPAAKAWVLNFYFTDFISMSITLFDGRIIATAHISPVSSSAA